MFSREVGAYLSFPSFVPSFPPSLTPSLDGKWNIWDMDRSPFGVPKFGGGGLASEPTLGFFTCVLKVTFALRMRWYLQCCCHYSSVTLDSLLYVLPRKERVSGYIVPYH